MKKLLILALMVPVCVFAQYRNGPYLINGGGGVTNNSGAITASAPFAANYLLPTFTYGVTNSIDAFGLTTFPQYRGHYVYSTELGMYTNAANSTNYFAKLGGNVWSFCTITNDTSQTIASNYVYYIGSQAFPTNDPISWVSGNQNTFPQYNQVAGAVWMGTATGPTNTLFGINATATSVTTIGGIGTTASNPQDDGTHVIDFVNNIFGMNLGQPSSPSATPAGRLGGWTVQYFTDPAYGPQLGSNYTSDLVLEGHIPLQFAATNTGANLASMFVTYEGTRTVIIRYKAKNVNGSSATAVCYESQCNDLPGINDYMYNSEYGHNHFGHLPHNNPGADQGNLDGPGWNNFWGGFSNNVGANPYPTIFINSDYLNKNVLPTVVTNGGISTDSTNIFIDQGGIRGSIVMNALVPKIPTAVTLTGSVFIFTNLTPSTLECYFSGSVAYAVAKNGAAVFGSLASDGYLLLQPTNKVTITYTVAPTMFTNAF